MTIRPDNCCHWSFTHNVCVKEQMHYSPCHLNVKIKVTSLHILRHMGKTWFEIEKTQSFPKQSIKQKSSVAVPSAALAVAQSTEVLWPWPSLLTTHCFLRIPLCSSSLVAFEKQAVDSSMWWDFRWKFSFLMHLTGKSSVLDRTCMHTGKKPCFSLYYLELYFIR